MSVSGRNRRGQLKAIHAQSGKSRRGGTKKMLKRVGERLGGRGGLKRARKHKAPALAGRKPPKGARKGQSIQFGASGYLKGGKYHEYDIKRDRSIKAKTTRKPGSARWRGDLPGALV